MTSDTLQGFVKEFVFPKSTVFTDEFASYDGLKHIDGMEYEHQRINHSARCTSWATFTPTQSKDFGV